MTTPVYLNACSLMNALGQSNATILDGLSQGYTGGVLPWDTLIHGRAVYVGQIPHDFAPVPADLSRYDCRNNRLMVAALQAIQEPIETLKRQIPAERIAVVLGSSTSGILEGENALQYRVEQGEYPRSFHYRQQEIGTAALFLREYLGLKGLAYTISTACSSSAKVFASARRLILSGRADAVIVGGIDTLCRLTVHGFSALESVSAGRCNPMSRHRDGINIGEAAAMFIMSREPANVQLLGVGESSDAHHMSAPDPTGHGARAAMQAALDDAGLQSQDIAYINMHGTATPLNDAMESQAIFELFGQQTPVSSTKPLVGHTLGAAGATEVGFCWLLLQQAGPRVVLPPHIWDGERDPALPELNLVQADVTMPVCPGTALLSNSFAFGGNNASVIVGRSE